MDSINQRRKKGGKKRTHSKPVSFRSQTATPIWLGIPTPEIGQTPTFQFAPLSSIAPLSQPQKPLGDVLAELLWEIAKTAWKQTDPVSYNFNQAMFALAPHWPPESRWMLGIGAIGSAVYGLGRVADRIDDTIERDRMRR